MGWNTTNGHCLWWYLGCLLKVRCQLILGLYVSFNYTWLTYCVCWNSQTQSYGTKPEPNYNDSFLIYWHPASDGGFNQAGQDIGCENYIIIDGHVKTTLACLKYRYSSCPFASMVNVKICLSSVAISFNFMIMQ